MVRLGYTEEHILREITEKISTTLNSVGLFNRVFSRLKTQDSIQKKIAFKKAEYVLNNKKMQDVFGIRVTVYFLDDEEIAISLLKRLFVEIPEAHSIDAVDKDRFGPQRLNLIFKIDEQLAKTSSLFEHALIDSTFEVQFRTVFSEGWHEVEHDLRYKCKDDWVSEDSLFRQLNGLLATLETCNWAMLKIFDELAYKKYKQKQWSSFFRNALRIRFEDSEFSEPIINMLDSKPHFAKELLKIDREKLIFPITKLTIRLPLKMDNIFFISNRAVLKSQDILNIEPSMLKQILDKSFE